MHALPSASIARLLSSFAIASSTLLLAQSATAYPGGRGAFNGKGFDTCAAPSSSQMQAWWSNSKRDGSLSITHIFLRQG